MVVPTYTSCENKPGTLSRKRTLDITYFIMPLN